MGDLIPWLPGSSSGLHLVLGAYSVSSCSDVVNESVCCLPREAHVFFVTHFKVLGIDAPDDMVDKEMIHGFLRVKIPDCSLLLLLFHHSVIWRRVLVDSWV